MSSLLTRLKTTLGSANADDHALGALRDDQRVHVKDGRQIEFVPQQNIQDLGVILYPGGRCDPRAYAPVMREIAAAGFPVFIPKMPLRLAVLGAKRAGQIMQEQSSIKHWVIGGHSMGGAMAAGWAHNQPDTIRGLFLMGSYAARMHAMPDSQIPVAVLHGTRDFFLSQAELDAQPERLPQHTEFIDINGGDHYQFGSFTNMEVTASIPRLDQQRQVTGALLRFLNSVAARSGGGAE